jgi:hypothetical protein
MESCIPDDVLVEQAENLNKESDIKKRIDELEIENKQLKKKIEYYESGAVCGCTPNDPDGSTRHDCPIHGYVWFAEAPDVRFC